jgi:small-conductance mechanosensitive channel|tara:strand:+ start:1119 stop:1616 length:498 start_codon:yes stop_codon:yes gene_type:complete
MNDSEYICPVPKDQRPLNEYKKLKESNNFLWCIQDKSTYLKSLFYMSASSFVFSYSLLIVSSFSVTNTIYISIYSVLSSIFIMTLLCLRSYLGWQYIYSRLMEATVPYEESGWYDGQVWIKPPQILLQDRLIGTYEIYPGLSRLQLTLIFLFVLFFTGITLVRNT